jgi:hypothetical protein
MARLGKHGTELLRIERELTITNPESSTDWQRHTRAYFADGKILEKYDVNFKPSTYRPKGERHSYGWKLHSQLKPGLPKSAMVDVVARKRELITSGQSKWVISGDTAPVVQISQARIMRAIESGEYIGFCQACGVDAHGVEPDARNYRCESCGKLEVYGAEELLIAG